MLASLHVLLLTDRDWAHPQGGGTGTNLYGQVARWIAWGHTVTVVAGSWPGAAPIERPHERLTIHRMGSRLTVFPRAAWATLRGVGRDADVVLEVVNGIAFFTPLWPWLRKPAATLVQHVHQDHYVSEMGRAGKVAALLAERLPLTLLYRWRPFLTISNATRDDLAALGLPEDHIHVVYMGTEPAPFDPVPVSPEPRLLYLGRLKQYKRIEVLLEVLEACGPETTLDIAGEGDHEPVLRAAVARRGLDDRVRFLGHVSEEEKAHLYDEAWISLTASSAEGWCLTVMEAADRGTPSAAMAVGGLPESIVDGRTGVLADEPHELAEEVAALIADDERRATYGRNALERARTFTWDRTAEENLALLEQAVERGRTPRREALKDSDTAKAAGLAGAALANNAIQLVFTVIVTRILGASGYGALAALISAFLIILVAGQSVQAAAARESALGRLGSAAMEAWTRRILLLTLGLTAVGIVLREPLAALIGVPEHPWGAAAILPTGGMWVLISLQRGVCQGLGAFSAVGASIIGEAGARLVLGVTLALAFGVDGAFIATPLVFGVVAVYLAVQLRSREAGDATRSLRSLLTDGWVPILALLLLAVLQNVDVIIARHQLDEDAAGAYAVAAVAAKSVVWVAIGVGLMLLPQATRRAAAGLDPRPVLMKSLGVLAAVSAPALLIFALFPHQLVRLAFGPDLEQGGDALLMLGVAMTLLAVAYLTVQYMLALRQARFLWVLAAVAVAEILILFGGDRGITGYAAVVCLTQLVAATLVLLIGLRVRRPGAGGPREVVA